MEIKDLLKTEVMILDLQATSKEAVIDEIGLSISLISFAILIFLYF